MSNNTSEPHIETLSETENFDVRRIGEPDGETIYYLQLGRATINFFQEEWDEFLSFVDDIGQVKPDEDGYYSLQFDNVDIWLDGEDWAEFKNLILGLKK
jgi:hypothetical protein